MKFIPYTLLIFSLLSCTQTPERQASASVGPVSKPTTPHSLPSTQVAAASAPIREPTSQQSFLSQSGPIIHKLHIAARWKASLGGLINLSHPAAVKAGLKDASVPILLAVHVLVHPTFGVFIVDSGITKKSGYGHIEVVESTVDILAKETRSLAGVLLTHSHYDHVMGFAELPAKTIIYAGPGELTKVTTKNLVVKRWEFKDDKKLGEMPAIDIVGDGSLWALWVPGHTHGSTAYLANTTDGPLLFTGDTSHTLWGWENGVGPGGYSANKVRNQKSVDHLKALVKEYPQIKVYVGHETDGVGTGVNGIKKK
jgi:N-acyl homoserine lactone hydrolase